MTIPVALATMLPVGIKGLLAMVAVFLSFTCHDTYMHSWGSIFVQDIVIPVRNRPLAPESMSAGCDGPSLSVAVFAFFFSLLYVETDKIFLFFAITGHDLAWRGRRHHDRRPLFLALEPPRAPTPP